MLKSSTANMYSSQALMSNPSPTLFSGEENKKFSSRNKTETQKELKSDSFNLNEIPFQYTQRVETRGCWAALHIAQTFATGGMAATTGVLGAFAGPVAAVTAVPTAILLGLQIATIDDNVRQRKKLNLIKKGQKKYALMPGSSGKVLKAHLTKRGAKYSVLNSIMAGDPTQLPKTASVPYKIALIKSHLLGKTFRKTIIYTHDADLARKLYKKQLRACQHYLQQNPRFLQKHPKYQALLHR